MPEQTESVRKAGKIASEARDYGAKLVKEGARALDVAEAVEKKIRELGAAPAFPCNVSFNHTAAHDLPSHGDTRVFKDGDVVKLDIGAHVDGWVSDTAVTVVVGKNELGGKLKAAAELALQNAIKLMVPGNTIGDVSAAIEKTIRDAGFNPVVNLTGHGVGQYEVHTAPAIPNIGTKSPYVLKEGDVFAIEPFVTTGVGMVKETSGTQIYRWTSDRHTRLPESTKILQIARERYARLPFAKRWLVSDANVTPAKLALVIKGLVENGSLYEYPPLREVSDAPVAQAEHTVIVGKEPEVVTA
ncbi:MAG: type II methionyl aminopeptidase [Candidatus Aenigmatarchaeota archaeon]|nr:MAG: type II methionyl aminopeptidase [Candidatus Aenigmarchaeota archaeon]